MKSEIKKLIAAIRKDVPSKMVKIQHDELFGTVTVTYVDKSSKAQQMYRLILEMFKMTRLPLEYKGSHFIVTYGTPESALQRMFEEAKSVVDELIKP